VPFSAPKRAQDGANCPVFGRLKAVLRPAVGEITVAAALPRPRLWWDGWTGLRRGQRLILALIAGGFVILGVAMGALIR
jgi:hypothetical protein